MKPVIGIIPLYDEDKDSIWTVSYTHLVNQKPDAGNDCHGRNHVSKRNPEICFHLWMVFPQKMFIRDS